MSERKSQRRFLQFSLRLKNNSGIPADSIEWLEQTINQTVTPPYSPEAVLNMSRTARMRAIYYILACRRDAGLQTLYPEADWSESAEYDFHKSMMEKPKEFFMQDSLNFECM